MKVFIDKTQARKVFILRSVQQNRLQELDRQFSPRGCHPKGASTRKWKVTPLSKLVSTIKFASSLAPSCMSVAGPINKDDVLTTQYLGGAAGPSKFNESKAPSSDSSESTLADVLSQNATPIVQVLAENLDGLGEDVEQPRVELVPTEEPESSISRKGMWLLVAQHFSRLVSDPKLQSNHLSY